MGRKIKTSVLTPWKLSETETISPVEVEKKKKKVDQKTRTRKCFDKNAAQASFRGRENVSSENEYAGTS